MLQPLPGTVDFATWEREATDVPIIDGVPLTRYWLIPPERRPRVYSPHPSMTADELRSRTQGVWDRFYALHAHLAALVLLEESSRAAGVRARLQAVSPDVRQYRHLHRQRPRAALGAVGTVAGSICPSAVRGRPHACAA